ncbi:hypothetical protein IAR50_002284 [Cryptococcus sp. DSM 104548]
MATPEADSTTIPWCVVFLCQPTTRCKDHLIWRGSSRPDGPLGDPDFASPRCHSLISSYLPLLHGKWVRAVDGKPRHCTYKWRSAYCSDPFAKDAQAGEVKSTLYIETSDQEVSPKGDDIRLILPHESGYLGLLTDSRPDFAEAMKRPLPRFSDLEPKSWLEQFGVYTFVAQAKLIWRDDGGVERESIVDVIGESCLSLERTRAGIVIRRPGPGRSSD